MCCESGVCATWDAWVWVVLHAVEATSAPKEYVMVPSLFVETWRSTDVSMAATETLYAKQYMSNLQIREFGEDRGNNAAKAACFRHVSSIPPLTGYGSTSFPVIHFISIYSRSIVAKSPLGSSAWPTEHLSSLQREVKVRKARGSLI